MTQSPAPVSPRKAAILAHSEKYAAERPIWRTKAEFFHREDEAYLRFLIPRNSRVLEIGCGIGDTLAALEPSVGTGVDFSPALIELARRMHPELTFHVGDAEDPATIAALGVSINCTSALGSRANRDSMKRVTEFGVEPYAPVPIRLPFR